MYYQCATVVSDVVFTCAVWVFEFAVGVLPSAVVGDFVFPNFLVVMRVGRRRGSRSWFPRSGVRCHEARVSNYKKKIPKRFFL